MLLYIYQYGIPIKYNQNRKYILQNIEQINAQISCNNYNYDFVLSLIKKCDNLRLVTFDKCVLKLSDLINLFNIVDLTLDSCTILYDQILICKSCPRLHTLNIINSTVYSGSCCGNTSIKQNEIDTLLSFLNTLSITHFNISKCNIKKIPHQICTMNTLTTLELTHCNIDNLPDCLTNLTNLMNLNISNNKLKYLNNKIFNMNLKTLNISSNPIDQIQSQIQNLKSLESLNIDHTKIRILPQEIAFLTNLNNITVVDIGSGSIMCDKYCLIYDSNIDFIIPYHIRILTIIQCNYRSKWNILCKEIVEPINQKKIFNNLPAMISEIKLNTVLYEIPKLPFGLKNLYIHYLDEKIDINELKLKLPFGCRLHMI